MAEEGPVVTTSEPAKRKPIGCIAVAVVLLLCAAGVAYILMDVQQTAATMEPLEPACAGQAVSAAAPYPPTSGLAQVVVFEEGTSGLRPMIMNLPSGWGSETVEAASLVLCAGELEEEIVQECDYSEEGDEEEFIVQRIRYQRSFVLYEAQTGNELLRETLQGSDPERCPRQQSFGSGNTVKLEGEKITNEEIHALIESFVTQP